MHTKTISIHRLGTPFMIDYRKNPFVNSKPGLEYRYFRKLWVLDISIKPNLLSPLHNFFTNYPTSTTLKLTTLISKLIRLHYLSALVYRPSVASDVSLISRLMIFDATFKSGVLYTIIYHFVHYHKTSFSIHTVHSKQKIYSLYIACSTFN